MRKLLLVLALLCFASPALAQNTQCSDRPSSDSSNACANTRFVQTHVTTPSSIALPNNQILIGNISNVAAAVTVSGDCVTTNVGLITCTKTNGVAFTPAATTPAISIPPTSALRFAITANATVYINPSSGSPANCNGQTCQPGSLANSCLSIASPCLTLQQATNVAKSWDAAGFVMAIQQSDGTYTSGTIIDGAGSGWGGAQAGGPAFYPLQFQGNSSTPANVVVSLVNGPCYQADHYAVIAVINITTKCVYDFFALNHAQIYVNGGVTTDGVNIANSLHYYATFYGSIHIDGANSYQCTGTCIPDALFQSTHQGNVRFGVNAGATLTARSNTTFAIATAYALTSADITATAGAQFIPNGFTTTGQCWRIEDASIQWAGGSGVCNNVNGFPGTLAGTINGGFGDFYTNGAWCTPVINTQVTGINATFAVPSCRGQLARYLWVELVGGGGGGAGSGTTPIAATVGGATCLNTTSPACTTPVYQAGGGALGTTNVTTAAGGTVSGTSTCDDSQNGGAGSAPSNQVPTPGGQGGNSRYGGGGAAGFSGNAPAAAAPNSGSGGGGAGTNATASSGGGGGAGAWCFAQMVTPPTAIFYTIGGKGNAGGAGAGGFIGSDGGLGKIKFISLWN